MIARVRGPLWVTKRHQRCRPEALFYVRNTPYSRRARRARKDLLLSANFGSERALHRPVEKSTFGVKRLARLTPDRGTNAACRSDKIDPSFDSNILCWLPVDQEIAYPQRSQCISSNLQPASIKTASSLGTSTPIPPLEYAAIHSVLPVWGRIHRNSIGESG